MAFEKYKGQEVFQRLYNQPQKKNIEKEVKKNEKNYKTINNNINEEYLNNLYQDGKLREKKNKEKEDFENKKRKEERTYKAASNSNKYLFNKFKNLYKNQIEKIIYESDKKKLDFNQLKELFINLNFIPQSQSENEIINNLLNDIYENLKDEKGLMSIDHIFIFCLSILSLFEYYILSNYQMNNTSTIKTEESQREITSSISQKNLKYNNSTNKLLPKTHSVKTVSSNDDISLKLDIINKDLSSRIENNVKFGGFDCDNNFIITSYHAKLISKYFISFYQYYNNPNLYKEETNNLNRNKKRISSSNSKRDSNTYMNNNKVKNQERNTQNLIPNNFENKRKKSNPNSKRLEQLYLDSAKKRNNLEKEKEKYLEQKEKEEKKICTFKPKINSNSHYKNNLNQGGENQELRMEMLYKKGTEYLLNKKDKTIDEIEVEKYKNELTFKPNIHEVNYDIFKKNFDIDDYDIEKFNKRLQKGREEKFLRESAFERGEFIIQNSRNFSENKKIRKDFSSDLNNKNKKRSFIENKTPGKERRNLNYSNNNINNIKISNNKINKNKHENENPILQIDVNLKHGIKKKVYVYEGDTAENLAIEFSEENGLDDKMRKKLQILIQQEIDKLLTKIEEESQSTFKSTNKLDN